MKLNKYQKWYKTSQWQRLRIIVLSEEPLCRLCRQAGHITPANTVDHINPHKGDWELFVCRDNLQALCDVCHKSVKSRIEKGGYTQGCDENGMPLDKNHPFNKRR